MRPNPLFAADDPELVKDLVREHPWATLVTSTASGLAASHYPMLVDEGAPGLTLLTHLGRPDEEVLEIDRGEVLVIVQGHHGYISPGWYSESERKVPTWNFTVAHMHGTPQRLDEEENLEVLTRLVARFEMKRKLSQNKDEETRRNAIAKLRELGPYRHPALAEEMERELGAAEAQPGDQAGQ